MTIQRLIVALLVTCVVSPLPAQEPEGHLSTLRTRTELSDDDRNRIQAFITERVGKIIANDATQARQATDDLRKTFAGTDTFKQAYAITCLDAVRPAFKKADLVPAARLLTVVNTFNVIEAQPVLLEALRDDRVGIRAAGAIGLRTLREELAAAGREACQQALTGLKEAGKAERSRDTLRAIYKAMNYAELPTPPNAKDNIGALLELLEDRARQCAAGEVRAVGADDTGLRVARALLKDMDAAERKRLTIVAATMTRYAIERYTSPTTKLFAVRDKHASRELLEARNAMERLVLVGEELLTALLTPEDAPSIINDMKKLNTANMKVEWQKWVTLLQQAVDQDFTLTEVPEPDEEEADAGGT